MKCGAPSVVYVNHGGIGFNADCDGHVRISDTSCHQPLRLFMAFDGKTIAEVSPPVDCWNQMSLAAALRERQAYILSLAPVDAYLGQEWIGSTEV